MQQFSNLKPERVFYYFQEICKIPRCSYEEKGISDYLKETAEGLGLEVVQDEALNIIIKKPGTKGYENKPTVILQGHMDMVCEKSDKIDFDFSKEGIKVDLEGDFLIAKETTLGADNGIAVAMCLAILESKEIAHPPLEVLVTSNEESGMTGASQLNPSDISGKILINIDSEEEGTILVSCAGGQRVTLSIPIEWESNKNDSYLLKVSGLMGGHSGMEIDKGRGNSNKIMGRILNELKEIDFRLAQIEGGSKSNAIPRSASARITIDKKDVERATDILNKLEENLKSELISTDKDISITLEQINTLEKVFSKDIRDKIITSLVLIPNGVQSMSMDIKGLVESSNNLGVVSTLGDKVTIESAIRSSVGSLKTHISNQLKLIAEVLEFEYESYGEYPAWEYKKESYIREVFKDSFKDLYNKDINIAAIHAGLECGLFREKLGDIDMVSFGPNMSGVHAPGEKLSISSTENTWKLLLKVLENIK